MILSRPYCVFLSLSFCKKESIVIQTIISIKRENKYGHLYADVVCSEKGTILRESKFSEENCEL